jgi:hypothetical protein
VCALFANFGVCQRMHGYLDLEASITERITYNILPIQGRVDYKGCGNKPPEFAVTILSEAFCESGTAPSLTAVISITAPGSGARFLAVLLQPPPMRGDLR